MTRERTGGRGQRVEEKGGSWETGKRGGWEAESQKELKAQS
jgi:hypothetical protein